MPNSKALQTLLLCTGKDCAKKQRRAFDDLRVTAAGAGLDICMVKCQGTCSGPTAVVPTPDGHRWFEDLDCPKARADVVALASGSGDQTKRLSKRELKGKRRDKAARKLAKQLA